MKNTTIQLPTEIARFTPSFLGMEIQWINPFDSISIFELRNTKGQLVYKMYMQNNIYTIPELDKYLTESYSIEVKNITSGEIKLYSIAY